VNNEAIYALARKFEAYPDGSKIPTLRGTGIIEFAAALLSQHEAEKRPPQQHVFQDDAEGARAAS
jgi:hypothetical protein